MSGAHTTVASPVGELLLTAEDGRLTGLFMPGEDVAAAGRLGARRRRVRRDPPPARGVLRRRAQRRSTFRWPRRERRSGSASGPSSSASSYGHTITYAELAARIGRPTAIRAAGAANGANPVSIVIPCHRVIGSNGSLTGYSGGLEAKRFLLDLERARA